MAVLFKFALNMFHVKQVRVVIETLYDLFTNLIPFAAIMASAYYVFAVMGMILFQDEIGGEKFAEEFQLINLTFPRVEVCNVKGIRTVFERNFGSASTEF